MTMTKKNALNWFEIYVADFERAVRFYETALGEPLQPTDIPDGKMAVFSCDLDNGVGGALTKMDGYAPGGGGTLIYLNVEGKLDEVLARTASAGGKVLSGRTAIPPHGFIGIIQDTEGNRVGLHSMS
jgi:predicted enzyme related to lactoylglutathione lyase